MGWAGEQEHRLCDDSLFGMNHLLPCCRVYVQMHSCWVQSSIVNFRFCGCCFALIYVRLMIQGMSMTLVKFGTWIPVWTHFSIQKMYQEKLLSGWLSPRVDSWWLPSCSVSLLNSLKNSTLPHPWKTEGSKSFFSLWIVALISPHHDYVMRTSDCVLPFPRSQPLLESLIHIHFISL